MTLRAALMLILLAILPAQAEELYGVPWGDARSCAVPDFYSSIVPPRNWVPKPYYVGKGFISVGNQLCHLTRIEGEPQDENGVSGFYVADCEFAYWHEKRRYTIAVLEQDDTLTMVWKSLASPETYRTKIGPLRKCWLGKTVRVPWREER